MRYTDDTHELRIQALEWRMYAVESALHLRAPVVPPPPAVPAMPEVPPASPVPPAAPPTRDAGGLPHYPGSPPPPRASAPAPVPDVPAFDLEGLLGGKLFAWIGGVAILVGVVFFVATAMQRGWIPEGVRVAAAFAGSGILLGVGLWLHERRGRTQASLVAVGTAVAGLYASLVAGTSLYHLIPAAVALCVATLVGVVATATAVRLESVQVAGLGIVGALLSPVLVDAGPGTAALVFMAIALSASTAVLVWQRWDWLALLAYLVSAPQLARWALDDPAQAGVAAVAVLVCFWGIYVVAALGYELRVPTAALRVSSALLVVSNVLFTAGLGWLVLHRAGHGDGATAWVLALAGLQVATGAGAALWVRAGREIPLLFVACGVSLSAIGLALALDGPWLVAGWAAETALLALVAARLESRRALVGSVAFLALAGALGLELAVTRSGYASSAEAGHRIAALLVVAVAAAVAARLLHGSTVAALGEGIRADAAFELVAGAFALLALPIALDGVALVAALAGAALVLVGVATWRSRGATALAAGLWGSVAVVLALHVAVPEGGYASPSAAGTRVLALVLVAAAAAIAAFLLRVNPWQDALAPVLELCAAGLLLVALPIALDGASLVAALAAGAVLLALAGRVFDRVAAWVAAGGWSACALAHVLLVEAPPRAALLHGVSAPDALALALACAAAVAIVAVARATYELGDQRSGLDTAAGLAALYGLSGLVVSAVPAGGGSTDGKQLALSAFWSLVGARLLVGGLARGVRGLRLGGIALLSLAIAKVFLYDLASLGSLTRVGSFIALGVLLLAAAYAYQRQAARDRDGS
jgi:uncharacterized membrane protein